MKYLFFNLFFGITYLIAACSDTPVSNANTTKEPEVCYNPNALANDTTKRSVKSAVAGKIGNASVNINYYSPKVRERVIWGGLVPFGEVWVTGGHDATNVEISQNFEINGVQIPAGKYAFFTIPGKEFWTVILNKKWDQHLANDYDQKEDLVRIQVTPETNNHTERLQYFVDDAGNNEGAIAVAWEKLKIRLPLKIKD